LTVCAPVLAAGLTVGLATSVVLAATQIQEFTLSFIPKALAMVGVALVCGPWMLNVLIGFTKGIINNMGSVTP
jgi:flagellar biosynthesis protein FliQ